MKATLRILPGIAAGIAITFLPTPARAATGDSVTEDDLMLARNPIIIKTRLTLGNEYTDQKASGKPT